MMRRTRPTITAIALLLAAPAAAGPPYQTDDPDPTEAGRIETYAFTEGDWDPYYTGSLGVEANYGAAKDVQLSLGLPLDVISSPLKIGRGNVELSAKWRFVNDETTGWSLATFPGVTLPTAKGAQGIEALLPLWGGWRRGDVAIFGGGGRVFTSVPGGRDHWVLGLAATRQFGPANIGIEVGHEGASEPGGYGVDTAGLGLIAAVGGPFAIVARAGPAREEHTGHVFVQTYFGVQGVFDPKK